MADSIPDSSKKLFDFIRQKTGESTNAREADSMSYMILEHIFGIDKTDVILDRSITLDQAKSKTLNQFIKRINQNEPIQYVIGDAYFMDRPFHVDPSVLIPRGETEELVLLILEEKPARKLRILDIGTGTGCIPITLMKEQAAAKCYALDISPKALKIARKNAERHEVSIEFILMDILEETLPMNQLDVIVSNPPYIPQSEKSQMSPNVLDFEPTTALFVPDDNPLVFYERIVSLAPGALKPNGAIYFEVNESFGNRVAQLMENAGFTQVEIKRDIHGKDRIVRGRLGAQDLSQPE